ncbi:unnamed protein product, partial [Ectocarpus fasciculatus]
MRGGSPAARGVLPAGVMMNLREGGSFTARDSARVRGAATGTWPSGGVDYSAIPAGAVLETGLRGDVNGFFPQGTMSATTPPAPPAPAVHPENGKPRGMHVAIPKIDDETECFPWKQRFINAAKVVKLDGQSIGDNERLVPVGDVDRSTADFE